MYQNDVLTASVTAQTDITKNTVISVIGDYSAAHGIATADAASGEGVAVVLVGAWPVIAQSPVSAGDEGEVDPTGKVQIKGAGALFGIALTDAQAGQETVILIK